MGTTMNKPQLVPSNLIEHCWYQGYGLGTAQLWLKQRGYVVDKSDIRWAYTRLSRGMKVMED